MCHSRHVTLTLLKVRPTLLLVTTPTALFSRRSRKVRRYRLLEDGETSSLISDGQETVATNRNRVEGLTG